MAQLLSYRLLPHPSLVERLRESGAFLRTTAALVIVAFGGLITAPAAAALRTAPIEPPGQARAEERDETKLAKAVQQVKRHLTRLESRLTAGEEGEADRSELVRLRNTLRQLDRRVGERFDAIDALIRTKGLGPTIEQRQGQARGHFRRHLDRTLGELDVIDRARAHDELLSAVRAARAHLDAVQSAPARRPFDPNQLPFKAQEPKPDNRPKETPAEFRQAGLYPNPLPKLAAIDYTPGDFTFDQLPGADDPAYLAASDEVVLSDTIRAKAAELGNDPVRIYYWVRNTIEWLPTWGATQDAELTLSARRGNAQDIASLTIALLRASGFPARYVHGTMDVPVDRYRNWIGGFSDLMAAADHAASGGIPTRVLSEGGQPAWVRMEHVWVEAAVDYYPGRGYRNFSADKWLNLDPSFKQYDYLEGLDVARIAGLDGQALADGFLASGTVNDAEGWIQGLDATQLTTAQATAQQALQDYLTNQLPNATVGDVIGGRRIIAREYETLPSSIQNPMVTKGAIYGALPPGLQHHVTLGFGNDGLGGAIQQVAYPFPKLNNHKVTISFKPSTAEDEAALLALLPEGDITDLSQLPDTIPAYLISVTPELKVDGQTVLTGTPMQLGEDLDFVYTLTNPVYGTLSYPGKVVAGSYLSVAIIGGSVAPEKLTALKTKLEGTQGTLTTQDQTQLAALTREDILGDMFYAGTLGYFAESQGLAHVMTLQQKAHMQQLPSGGTYGYVPQVDYFWGMPNSLRTGGVSMDLDALNITAQTDDGTNKFNLVFQLGALSSALEHAIPEQMFVTAENPGEAVSTVKALSKAAQQGQKIYHITQANLATALADIRLDDATIQEIRDAVATGKEVITHADPISVPGWSGAGYAVFDPAKGDGAWRIGGGSNGSILKAIGVTAKIAAYFYGFLSALARAFAGGIKALGTVSAFLGLTGFLLGIVDSSMRCSGGALSAVIVTHTFLSLITIGVVFAFIWMAMPLLAFAAGAVLGYFFNFIRESMTSGPFCRRS